ncbi:MAG: iron-sulfur cluster assembly protein [Limisphaerales bacterium]
MIFDVNLKNKETMSNILTEIQSPVVLTEGAISEIRKLIIEKEVPQDCFLRIGVKGGGCSGMSYILGFDRLKDNDQQFKYEELTVLMDPAHGMYLIGMEIDYVAGLNNRGFTFNNPNAEETCGCGSSFSA